jgi:hypothetical protein
MYTTLSKKLVAALVVVCGLVALSTPASAVFTIEYDQNVTNNVIFGSGNVNGSYTTNRANGVELGLRAKLRHNQSGAPENTFNSNGDGTYTFQAGVAPTQAFPTAVWSFEWSINSNYDGTSGADLADLTYGLSMTSSTGASIPTFDPINGPNPGAFNLVVWDHSIGTNATGNGAGTEAISVADYGLLINNNNLAQNSWKAHWYIQGFDPTETGTYDFVLTAVSGANVVASTGIQVQVVPEPASMLLLVMSTLGGLLVRPRRNA